jgi:arginyl-tRNA synthetase
MVVNLQSGTDPHARQVWKKLVEISKRGFEDVYQRLQVVFPDRGPGTGYYGESAYQELIPAIIKELLHEKKIAIQRDGAVMMFTGAPLAKVVNNDDGTEGEVPLILQKSDGGFGYDSTDMAAIKFRLKQLHCTRLLYVTDSGQEAHFQSIFAGAQLAGWVDENKRLEHIKFGVVTQKGGGKFKTRSGTTVTLVSLLDEARDKMKSLLLLRREKEKSTSAIKLATYDDTELNKLSAKLGYAAVKYADLRCSREKDYEFDLDHMLSFDGDTAVYLLYAYARVSSVIDRAEGIMNSNLVVTATTSTTTTNNNSTDQYNSIGTSLKERRLALRIARFPEIIRNVEFSLTPHSLCAYLYALSYETSTFLTDDNERVLMFNPDRLEEKRGLQRLILVKAVKSTLYEGLGLLGIVPLERM